MEGSGMASSVSGYGPVVSSCEHGNDETRKILTNCMTHEGLISNELVNEFACLLFCKISGLHNIHKAS
jgi:hypothetical protein